MQDHLDTISLSQYTYSLPEARIAKFPLAQRDTSKLLKYQSGQISHHIFHTLPELLPKNAHLVFNNTRVIPARVFLRRQTGALIEIFLLEPHQPTDMEIMMQTQGTCTWKCMIGNKKKWKPEEVLQHELQIQDNSLTLRAHWEDREQNLVTFAWETEGLFFLDILPKLGEIPLPPYLNREVRPEDQENYQTVYARKEGAVAAPTAGLHFTENLLKTLQEQGFSLDYLTLHVGAGTFQPVKDEQVTRHAMHNERLWFTQENIQTLYQASGPLISVGTTSMRALESVYWFGMMLHEQANPEQRLPFMIPKLYPYQHKHPISTQESLELILEYMQIHQMQELWGQTEIFILPGYQFKLCKGLITNFHLPKSTLLLLIAAFIGEDWHRVYAEALQNEYRFLSFGDSSLLLPGV